MNIFETNILPERWRDSTVWIERYTVSLKTFALRLEKNGSFANLRLESSELYRLRCPSFWESSELRIENIDQDRNLWRVRDVEADAEILGANWVFRENVQYTRIGKRYSPFIVTEKDLLRTEHLFEETVSELKQRRGYRARLCDFKLFRTENNWDNLLEIRLERSENREFIQLLCVGVSHIEAPHAWENSKLEADMVPFSGYVLRDVASNVEINARIIVSRGNSG